MAAKIQARDLRGIRKVDIVKEFPMSTPLTMFIEPTNACNMRCAFCPTGHPKLLQDVGRKNTLMDFEAYKRLINDIAEFPSRLKMLNMYKDGESLIHPKFCDMVRYAKESSISEKIWVKTNGQLLNPDYNRRLVRCGLDMIGISVNGVDAASFYNVTRVKVDYEAYRANVLDLYNRRGDVKISCKIADTNLTEWQKQKFIADFSDRCDFITIEGLHGWSVSEIYDWKLGTDQSFDGTPRKYKIACPIVLYMLTVSANGDVSICNDDWAHFHQIGNVNTESIIDIWYGSKLKEFRRMHLEGKRDNNAACFKCDYMQALPDSIDDSLNELLQKLA